MDRAAAPASGQVLALRVGHMRLDCRFSEPLRFTFDPRFVPPEPPADGLSVEVDTVLTEPGAGCNGPLPDLPTMDPERLELMAGWEANPELRDPALLGLLHRAAQGGDSFILLGPDTVLVMDFVRRQVHQRLSAPVVTRLIRREPAYALRPLLPFLACRLGGAFLHAAGLLGPGGRAFLFLAPSGGGKSTIAHLGAARYRILGDDHVGVLQAPAGYQAGATPLNRRTDGPATGRIAAICLLRKASAFTLVRRGPLEAMPAVWGDNGVQWASLPPSLRRELFERFWVLLQTTPVLELSFRREHVDWDALERAAEG